MEPDSPTRLRRIAEQAGFQVVGTLRVDTLSECNALLQAAGELWPDLIVLDISIPDLDGTESSVSRGMITFCSTSLSVLSTPASMGIELSGRGHICG
jgi:AmiR/NasT family two-component response regulator